MAVQFEAVCEPKFMTFWDDVVSNRSYFRACGRFWIMFCSASLEIRRRKKKNDERKKESVVKCKSADMYVGRSNKLE